MPVVVPLIPDAVAAALVVALTWLVVLKELVVLARLVTAAAAADVVLGA